METAATGTQYSSKKSMLHASARRCTDEIFQSSSNGQKKFVSIS
jgi:hypothetical protein